METHTTLVGTDGIVVLDAVCHICAHLPGVVNPRNTEHKHAVGDAKPLYKVVFLKFGVLVIHIFNAAEHLLDCLKIFRLSGEPAF